MIESSRKTRRRRAPACLAIASALLAAFPVAISWILATALLPAAALLRAGLSLAIIVLCMLLSAALALILAALALVALLATLVLVRHDTLMN